MGFFFFSHFYTSSSILRAFHFTLYIHTTLGRFFLFFSHALVYDCDTRKFFEISIIINKFSTHRMQNLDLVQASLAAQVDRPIVHTLGVL